MWIPLSIKKQDFILELKKRLKCVKHGKNLVKPGGRTVGEGTTLIFPNILIRELWTTMCYKSVFCWQLLLQLFIQTNAFACSSRSVCRPAGLLQDAMLLRMADKAASDSESPLSSTTMEIDEEKLAAAASKFQVTTCLSSACNKKRKEAGLDPLSTFAAMYERSKQAKQNEEESDLLIHVEERPCMGACQFGPCVAIEHAEFEGSVALEGMTEVEFANRVFQNILTEEDADRVWESVENAVQIMAEEEE